MPDKNKWHSWWQTADNVWGLGEWGETEEVYWLTLLPKASVLETSEGREEEWEISRAPPLLMDWLLRGHWEEQMVPACLLIHILANTHTQACAHTNTHTHTPHEAYSHIFTLVNLSTLTHGVPHVTLLLYYWLHWLTLSLLLYCLFVLKLLNMFYLKFKCKYCDQALLYSKNTHIFSDEDHK